MRAALVALASTGPQAGEDTEEWRGRVFRARALAAASGSQEGQGDATDG